MSVEDHQDTPHVLPRPVIPASHSLEDGEIVEGHVSERIADTELPRPNDQSQLQVHLSDPTGASSPVQPVDSPRPTPALASTGLTPEPMTDEDLDRAKSLVLDLLGWGVTPEYLVDCGLSPGAIYKIFTDLRLRLPRNLDLPSPPTAHPIVR